MTWIIRNGEVLNPGGDGIRLENAPADVEISQMTVNANGSVGLSITGASTDSIELDELVKQVREQLNELPSGDRSTAADLLKEVEKGAPPSRVMAALKIIYDLAKGIPGSILVSILRDALRGS